MVVNQSLFLRSPPVIRGSSRSRGVNPSFVLDQSFQMPSDRRATELIGASVDQKSSCPAKLDEVSHPRLSLSGKVFDGRDILGRRRVKNRYATVVVGDVIKRPLQSGGNVAGIPIRHKLALV